MRNIKVNQILNGKSTCPKMHTVGQAFTLVAIVAKAGFRNLGCAFSQRGICYIPSLAHLLISVNYDVVICLTHSHFSLKYTSIMDVPVVSTFVQFGNVDNSVTRSKSAPATALRNVIRTGARKLQWPSKRILRRWYNITERVLEQHHETVKLLATQESRRAWLKPKLRLHLPKDAYDVFLYIFEDRNLVSQPLEALGVIRDVGDSTVQFWSSDACLKT